MGLPGSGKSYLADKIATILGAEWLNADRVREAANDWDFSPKGRTRQAERKKRLAQEGLDRGKHVIAYFVCPTNKNRIQVTLVPNITNICYGRGVGYKIEEIILPENIQKISATDIRKKMREEGTL